LENGKGKDMSLERMDDTEQIGILREVSALRAENAELRRQLENSVALPCKVGATIWIIINEFPQFGGKYVKSEEVLEVSSNGRIWTDGCEYDTDDIGKQIFLTKAEAEQTLKERENNG
jgi:hypothetical protein